MDADDIVTGAGSLGALNQILKTFAGVNADGVRDEVIYAWRSFGHTRSSSALWALAACRCRTCPTAHDLDAMAAAITDHPPDPGLPPQQPDRPRRHRKPDPCVPGEGARPHPVVIDEAYFEFCAASTVPEGEEAR